MNIDRATMTGDVSMVIPSIPPRVGAGILERALESVRKQTVQPRETIIEIDDEKKGAGVTRTRGLMKATSTFVAFMDDDDTLSDIHLEALLEHQEATDADIVYPWFHIWGGVDPFPMFENVPWDPANPHIFPITTLVRTELAKEVGGFPSEFASTAMGGEDWVFWKKMFAAGAKVSHLPRRTWTWWHVSNGNNSGLGNTSGVPFKW